MPDRITKLIPRPTPVTLGSRTFPVWEATLQELADLQAWLDARVPGDDLERRLAEAGDDPVARDRALFESYEAADGELSIDDGEGRRLLFGTPEGYGAFLLTALARGTSGIGQDDVIAVLSDPDFDPAQLGGVRGAFFGTDRLGMIASLLGLGQRRGGGGGTPLTWAEAVDGVAERLGVPYREVYAMSLSEFRAARRGGRPSPGAFEGLTQAETVALQRRICLARYGSTPEEMYGPPAEFKTSAETEDESGWVRRNGFHGGGD